MGFLAAAAPLIGLVGTGIGAVGAISQGNAAAASANYGAQVATNNATIATQNANYASAAGETQAYNQGLKQREIAGAVRGGIAASGIDVNSGSAAKVQESQAALGLQDVEQVRQTAALQNYGYKTQATGFAAQSQLSKAEAGFDEEAGWLKGTGALLSGTAKYGTGGITALFGDDSPTDANLQAWGVSSGPNNPYHTTP